MDSSFRACMLAGLGLVASVHLLSLRRVQRNKVAAQAKTEATRASLPRDWKSPLVDRYDSYIFDCDGVIYHGGKALPGSSQAVAKLQAMGKSVCFLTNGSGYSRVQMVTKLERLGIRTSKEKVFTSSYSAAAYLAGQPPAIFDNNLHKVFAIGGRGIELELAEKGIQAIMADDLFGGKHLTREQLAEVQLDPAVRAVVVGNDLCLTYTKVSHALQYVLDPACLFVGTNCADEIYPGAKGQMQPAGGSCIEWLRFIVSRTDVVDVGKPSQWVLDQVVRLLCAETAKTEATVRRRTLMVGDKLNSDVLLGQRGGLDTCLVFTGVTSREIMATDSIVPTYTADSVGTMFGTERAPEHSSV